MTAWRDRWWPYFVAAAVHWLLTLSGAFVVLSGAQQAADLGMLSAPLWLEACAVVTAVLCLPALLPFVLLQLFGPLVAWDNFLPLIVPLALGNSLLAAWIARVIFRVRKPGGVRARRATA
jgi:hypothetical protein